LKLNFTTLAIFAVLALVFATHANSLSWTVPRLAGIALAVPSFALFVLARLQLGRAFSVQAKASILVTTGLYSRIRNPIYFFGALMIAGVIIFTNRPLLFLIFAILIPLQIYRSRKEEQVLTEKFGQAYLDYKRKTWF
jgi:protein-S-isoprenylcysteine O-methyltransferase Ste14